MTRIVPVLLALVCACSFAVVRPSPAAHAAERPSCRSSGWFALDLLGALASAGIAKLSTARFEGGDPSAPEDHSSKYVFGGAAVVLAASAIYGIGAKVTCINRLDAMTNDGND